MHHLAENLALKVSLRSTNASKSSMHCAQDGLWLPPNTLLMFSTIEQLMCNLAWIRRIAIAPLGATSWHFFDILVVSCRHSWGRSALHWTMRAWDNPCDIAVAPGKDYPHF
jgi:hypothetical protein